MNKFNEVFLNRMKILLKDEYEDFFNSLQKESVKSIYVNQNKISLEKFKEIVDFDIEQIPYEKAGFYVDNEKKGRHVLHHAGAFYMQEPSAMFTVNALNFKGDEYVLDMCSAPGGKSIQIANRISNGLLVSNEINKSRSEILYSNIERMGLKNVIITNEEPENIAQAYGNCFDVCLVDAPCSGEGMFRKGEDVSSFWNENLPQMSQARQLEILDSADKCLKQGGYLIYSTCTYAKEENEDVVNKFMDLYGYELINIDANFNRGINLPETVRLYPHKVRGEGQYVALLKKKSVNENSCAANARLQTDKTATNFIKTHTNCDFEAYEYNNYAYYVKNPNFIKRRVNYLSIGVRLGQSLKGRFEPHHNLFTAFGTDFRLKLNYKMVSADVLKYLKGEVLDSDLIDGYGAMLVEGCALGGFKISQGKFKNLYPKGLRNFK